MTLLAVGVREEEEVEKEQRILLIHITKIFQYMVGNLNAYFIGFGAYSYFYLMERLMILFLILSVLASINMFLFGYFGDNDFSDSFLDYVGLGHLGFSSTYCRDIPFHVGELTLK